MTILFLLWICSILRPADAVYSTTTDSAIRTATVGQASYDPVSRPSAQTNVKVGLSILAIDALDLKNQQFSAAGWLTFEWTDSRCTWTTASNGDIESIFVKPDTIWKPELLIDNSLDDLGVINDANLHLRLSYDGAVEWEPPELFTVHCEVDISYYPYDHQKCGIEVVSWGYTIDEVSLEAMASTINLDDFETHGEWDIEKTTIELGNLTETTSSGTTRIHPELIFWMYLGRRSQFYDMNVMIPIIVTSLLVVLTFVVSVESGEKLSYVLTVFLSLAVLLTLVADALPSTSITVSVLGVYLTIVLVLSALACFMTVLVMKLYHKEGTPSGSSVAMVIYRVMAKLTCTPLGSNESSRPSSPTKVKVAPAEDVETDTKQDSDVINDITWMKMAVVLDKLCFIVFAIVTVAVNVSVLIALSVGGATNTPD